MPKRRTGKGKKKRSKDSMDKNKAGRTPINPFALSAMFLNYCMENGWLIREKKGNITAYYITDEGRKKLPKLGIDISQI